MASPFSYGSKSAVLESDGKMLVLYGDDVTNLWYDTNKDEFVMITESSSIFKRNKQKSTDVRSFCNEVIDELIKSVKEEVEMDLDGLDNPEEYLKNAIDILSQFKKLY